LDRLNHALAAWLDQSYHQQPNSETRQAPRERYWMSVFTSNSARWNKRDTA
jgi:hypothetical protein